MSRTPERMLLWAPRLLAIAYVIVVALFALDAVRAEGGSADEWIGFAIHLSPAVLIAAAVAVAWHLEGWGAVLFGVVALLYPALHWGRMEWPMFALLSGTPLVVGLLFLAHRWMVTREPPPPRQHDGPLSSA